MGKKTQFPLKSISEEDLDAMLKELMEYIETDKTFDEAKSKFMGAFGSTYCQKMVHGEEAQINHAKNVTKKYLQSGKAFKAKPTMTINCVARNMSAVEKNYANVTPETRRFDKGDMKNRVGIAGSWLYCDDCGRKWNSTDSDMGFKCPSCGSANNHIMAEQAAPAGTIGTVNKKENRTGDISIFNTKRLSVFVNTDETDEDGNPLMDEAFISFTGKLQELLGSIKFGIPFSINVAENDYFVQPETGVKFYNLTGTSKVGQVTDEIPDIMDIYANQVTLASTDLSENGSYGAFFLQVVDEPFKPKEDGRWVVNLIEVNEETEEGDTDAAEVTMYIDTDDIAEQFNENDAGIFEARYSEQTRTIDGETVKLCNINVPITECGVSVFLLGENKTKLIN